MRRYYVKFSFVQRYLILNSILKKRKRNGLTTSKKLKELTTVKVILLKTLTHGVRSFSTILFYFVTYVPLKRGLVLTFHSRLKLHSYQNDIIVNKCVY